MNKKVIICGLPGTGKTTVAKTIAEELNIKYINDYAIFEELKITPPTSDRQKVSQTYARDIFTYLKKLEADVVVDLDYSLLPKEARLLKLEYEIIYLGFEGVTFKQLKQVFRKKDSESSDKELDKKIQYLLKISAFCKRECEKYGFDFVAIDKNRDSIISNLTCKIRDYFRVPLAIKAVMFDFDGTLTHKGKSIWDKVWEAAGYDIGKDSYYHSLTKRFLAKEYDYQKWCDLTCEALRKNKFSKAQFEKIISTIKLIDGVEDTCKMLTAKGIKLCIISGGEKNAICRALQDNVKYFYTISANTFEFDEDGIISYIASTKYDFEGKALFIQDFVKETKTSPCEILFVGNSDNDEWAHLSGCKTLCINAHKTNPSDKTKWHKNVSIQNLKEILKYIGE